MPESTLRSRISSKAKRASGLTANDRPHRIDVGYKADTVLKPPTVGGYRVLVIGDTHCPGMRPDYPDFLMDVYRKWDCNRVVHIGDLVDWHAINFHGKDPNLPDVKREIEQAKEQVHELYSRFPDADWLLGNHDALPYRRAADAGLPDDLIPPANQMWGIPRWAVYPRFHRLEIDGVMYSHGETGAGGKYAAISQSQANFQSTVIGHFHANAGVWWTANHHHRVFGLAVGTGLDWRQLQFSYGMKFARKPVLGCGVVIDGIQAYFEPMPLE